MTREQIVLEYTPSVDVPIGGTMVFNYLPGMLASELSLAGSTMAIFGNSYPLAGFYNVKLGDDAATVTLTGIAATAGEKVYLGLFKLTSPIERGQPLRDVKAFVRPKTANFTLGDDDKGAFVHANSASSIVGTLPNDWRSGDGCIIRRLGAGNVFWAAATGATVVLPTSKAAHTGVSERHEEITLRVLSNTNGVSAIWAINGATA